MQNAVHFQPQLGAPGLTLVEMEAPPAAQMVGVSTAWRKLVTQAEMAAPHIQVAAIEGEHGAGKQTLARFLFSPLSPGFNQLSTAGRPRMAGYRCRSGHSIPGFIYLDRVDLLAQPGQGLLLAVLKAIQDRAPGRAVIVASSQTSLRQMAGQGLLLPDLAFRLTAVRFAIPPPAAAP